MDDKKQASVTLDEPIKRGDTLLTDLTLRRPDAGALRGLSMMDLVRMDAGAVAEMLPRISSPPLTNHEVAQMGAADLFACGVEISSFFMKRADLADSPAT